MFTDQPILTNVQKIQKLRGRVDGLNRSLALLDPSIGLTIAHHEGVKAKMWLGNTLKELGTASPYEPTANRRLHGGSDEIAPEADVMEPLDLGETRLQAVDRARLILGEYIREVKALHDALAGSSNHWVIFNLEEALKCLVLTRNFLGIVLGEIRHEAVRTS